jgi:hypothetical protein
MDMLLVFGFFCLGFAFGGATMAWFWVNHCASIVDDTLKDVLDKNGLVRDGLKIVIRGEDAL